MPAPGAEGGSGGARARPGLRGPRPRRRRPAGGARGVLVDWGRQNPRLEERRLRERPGDQARGRRTRTGCGRGGGLGGLSLGSASFPAPPLAPPPAPGSTLFSGSSPGFSQAPPPPCLLRAPFPSRLLFLSLPPPSPPASPGFLLLAPPLRLFLLPPLPLLHPSARSSQAPPLAGPPSHLGRKRAEPGLDRVRGWLTCPVARGAEAHSWGFSSHAGSSWGLPSHASSFHIRTSTPSPPRPEQPQRPGPAEPGKATQDDGYWGLAPARPSAEQGRSLFCIYSQYLVTFDNSRYPINAHQGACKNRKYTSISIGL